MIRERNTNIIHQVKPDSNEAMIMTQYRVERRYISTKHFNTTPQKYYATTCCLFLSPSIIFCLAGLVEEAWFALSCFAISGGFVCLRGVVSLSYLFFQIDLSLFNSSSHLHEKLNPHTQTWIFR